MHAHACLWVLCSLLRLGWLALDWNTPNQVEELLDKNTLSDDSSLEPRSQPHIIFILIDDQGYNDIGYHNPSIKTPTLDKMAAEGVKLENYYVQPICTPSRSQLMTGRYQIHTGLQHSIIRPRQPSCLPLHMDTLPQRLQQAGYATHMVGKWHLGFYRKACLPTRKGFDSFFGSLTGSVDYYSYGSCDGPGLCGYDLHDNEAVAWGREGQYSTMLYTQRVRKILEGHNPAAKPLFLLLSLQAVHTPLQPPKSYIYPYRDMFNIARRRFAAMVSTVDEAVRNVTYALRKYGYYRNSVIIYSTDNGAQPFVGGSNWPLRGRKGTYWEGGVRGVAFVHSPLLRRRRRVSKALLHITDWFPTLVGLAGGNISQSEGLDGFDVWSTISEGKESPRHEILHNIDPLHRPPVPSPTTDQDHRPPAVDRAQCKKGKKAPGKVPSKKVPGPAGKKPKQKIQKRQAKKHMRRQAKLCDAARQWSAGCRPLSSPTEKTQVFTRHRSKSQPVPQKHKLKTPTKTKLKPKNKPKPHLKSQWSWTPGHSLNQSKAKTQTHFLAKSSRTLPQYNYQSYTGPPWTIAQPHLPGKPQSQPQPQLSQPVWDTSVQAAIRVGDWKLLTGDPGHGDWVPPQVLTTLPGHWWNLERTSPSSPIKTAANKSVWLFNISGDPYERRDVSQERPDVVQHLLVRLASYNRTAVPVRFPPNDSRANPDRHGGAWVPWVSEEGEEESYRGMYRNGKYKKKKRKKRKKCRLCKLNSFFMSLNSKMMSSQI